MTQRRLFDRRIDSGCRTHRERKEQYTRRLEEDVSRLKEAYAYDITAANKSVKEHRDRTQTLTDENDILKEILSAHGIPFEAEVERRKAERGQYSPFNSSAGSQIPGIGPGSQTTPVSNTPPTTVSANISPPANDTAYFDISPPQPFSSEPPSGPISHGESMGTFDRSGHCDFGAPVQAIGGIFEEDPQLQIDFILTCATLLRLQSIY